MRRGRKTAKLAMARSLAIALLLGHITKEGKIESDSIQCTVFRIVLVASPRRPLVQETLTDCAVPCDILPRNSARAGEASATREPILLSLIEHPWLLFPVLLVGLMLVVEAGLRLRYASPGMDEERQSLIKSARNSLTC